MPERAAASRALRFDAPAAPARVAGRFDRLDLLRGVAVVWMAGYHLCFDLSYFGLLPRPQNFYGDPFWITQRVCIVSLFLFCAGCGQAIAIDAQQGWSRFWRRWIQIAGCAFLVSAGSAIMFPTSWISFGVLHGIAVMLLLCRLSIRRARSAKIQAVLGLLGALAIALPQWVQLPFFDTRWTNWVGLVTHKPITEDWVPLLPWLGPLLWGLAVGRALLQRNRSALGGTVPALLQTLVILGRWSLTFYMLHQLVFIGSLQAGRRLGAW